MEQPSQKQPHAGSRGYFVLIALVIILMNTMFLLRENQRIRSANEAISIEVAGTLFDSIVTTRAWNATHQGVYVPISEKIKPNPYLRHPQRDVVTTDGRHLTMINPAYMTRLISELMENNSAMSYKITSLHPINPVNAPDGWEQEALHSFYEGNTSYYSYESLEDGSTVLRYMEPMYVDESCMSCHQYQGYEVGDVRGGIAVNLPFQPFQASIATTTQNNLWTYGSMSFLMLVLLMIIARMYENKEKQLITMSQQAVEANQAKSQFLANMNHEIRTPLNGIAGFLQLLKTTEMNEQQAEYIQLMDQSSQHLLGLVNNVLDMAKVEAGQIALEEEVFSVEKEVEKALAPLRSLAEAKNLTLELDYQDDIPTHLVGDPKRIRQVILNIVGNAVKFTDAGSVTLRVESLGRQRGRLLMCLVITDTGPGMSQEVTDQLFQPFYQGKDGVNPQGGTGLGMAITQELVNLMKGHIQVTSQLGQGSQVTVTLPLLEPSPKQLEGLTQAMLPDALETEPLNMLLVDDQEVNRTLLQRMLCRYDHRCDLAENGKEAVEACGKKVYDLVIMDIQMPEMDGLEATRRIRNLPLLQQPSVVAMTAYATREDKVKCLAAGMDGYLTKPIDMNQLKLVLLSVANQQASQRAPLLAPQQEQHSAQASTECDEGQNLPLQSDQLLTQGMKEVARRSGLSGEDVNMLLEVSIPDWQKIVSDTLTNLEEDPTTTKQNLHKLKGSFANMGITPLAALAKKAEGLLEGENREGLKRLLSELHNQVEGLAQALARAQCQETDD